MLADRFCIASKGQIKVVLSPEDMVTCNFGNAGCDGGLLSESVNYLITEGVVTETCKPYVSGEAGLNGFCQYSCGDLNTAYEKYACKIGSGKMLSTYDEIMNEIYTNGPVQVGFVAYSDFYTYSTGIYEKTPSAEVYGGHAVKLIGWNYDSSNRLYWICENEWGTSWGLNGFFYIYAGQCGLDSLASSCDPDLALVE
jgi:cathepsin B